MRARFKLVLVLIGILFLISLSLGVGYLFYDKVIASDSVIVVDGNITINFLTSNEFNLTEDGTFNFSVTNTSDDNAYYYIQFQDVKGAIDTVTFELVSEEGDVDVTSALKSDIVSSSLELKAKETKNYTINFMTDEESVYSGKVVVASVPKETTTLASLILAQNEVKEASLTKIGELATEDEGLIKDTTSYGNIYYFRGNVLNNYVSFANQLWKVVKINEDNSVKLVLNNVIDVLTKYNEDSIDFNDSNITESLDNWYNLNLSNYADYIANYKFCNDLTLNGDSFNAYNRIVTDKNPLNVCLGEEINRKIGLLTADEVVFAGASTQKNESYYLYNPDIKTAYYTMTSAKKTENYYPFLVNTDGSIIYDTSADLLRAARPVINIIANIGASGQGTIENPYVLGLN